MSNGNGHRWSKFWWRDHQGDAALRACSLAARGYWMELLCIAHEAERMGYVLLNGNIPTGRQLAAIAGCTEREAKKYETELESSGVFSRTEDGTIFCRRMVRDASASEAGKAWGSTGGNPGLKPKSNGVALSSPLTGGVNPPPLTPPDKPTRYEIPQTPPVKGGGYLLEEEAEEEAERKQDPSVGSPPVAGNRRADGTNPRATETNPRIAGENPRATGDNPRATGKNPRNAHPIPDDWQPSGKALALGVSLGLTNTEIAFEADKMRDWARSKPSKAADWDARFNNWLRNEISERTTRRFLPAKAATLQAEWGLKSFLTPNFDDDDEPQADRLLS